MYTALASAAGPFHAAFEAVVADFAAARQPADLGLDVGHRH